MGKISIEDALNNVEMTYSELNTIANDMVSEFFEPINSVVDELGKDINSLTNDEIRNYMINLAVKSFSLGELKEKSALKATCAEALRKEAYAREYTLAEGNNGAKDSTATKQIASQVAVEALYELVANLFKTKLDETHRVIDALKSVTMSRMSEAKLTTNTID